MKWVEWREALRYTALFYFFGYLFIILPVAGVLAWQGDLSYLSPMSVILAKVLFPSYPILVIGYRLRKWMGPLPRR